MHGFGLIKGLKITLKRFVQKKITQKYPEEMPILPSRSHQSFAFYSEKCISCELCSKACPNGVIRVEYQKDEKGKRILDDYRMNLEYCMFCGLCIEVCPTAALNSDHDFKLVYEDRAKGNVCWKGKAKEKDETFANK
jgi:NADH-quinone oxidoreductase subunit I